MNKEISEKRIEKEISILSNSELPIKINKVNKDDYSVDIIFQGSDLNSQLDGEIEFLIIFGTDFPYKSPKAFCLTQFSTPSIADGRDLIEDLLGQTWIPSFKIIDIISKIPEFVNEYIKNLQNGQLVILGNYYLADKYDLSMLEILPVFLRKVKETIVVDDKERVVERWLMVSDLYLCLFEQEKWSKNNLVLVFWTSLRALITIRKNVKEEIVKFYFKQKHRKSNYELALNFDDSDILIGSILKTMQTLGINYKVKKQGPPKSGSLPSINIEEVEKIIQEKEPKVEENPDLESVNNLMDLYQKAIEYYSATNDAKYEYYLGKVHELLKCPRMQMFLQNDKINVVKSPRVKAVSAESNSEVNNIPSNQSKLEDEEDEVKVKKDSGPEIKVITEVVTSGVIIEQNDNNEFLNKLANGEADEEEEEEEEDD